MIVCSPEVVIPRSRWGNHDRTVLYRTGIPGIQRAARSMQGYVFAQANTRAIYINSDRGQIPDRYGKRVGIAAQVTVHNRYIGRW